MSIEAQIPPAEEELNISLEPPLKEEMKRAIKTQPWKVRGHRLYSSRGIEIST